MAVSATPALKAETAVVLLSRHNYKNSNSTSLIIIKTHFNENQINQNKHMCK